MSGFPARACQIRKAPVPLGAQLVELRLGVLEIGGIEAFGEPAVDVGEHRARFVEKLFLRSTVRPSCSIGLT